MGRPGLRSESGPPDRLEERRLQESRDGGELRPGWRRRPPPRPPHQPRRRHQEHRTGRPCDGANRSTTEPTEPAVEAVLAFPHPDPSGAPLPRCRQPRHPPGAAGASSRSVAPGLLAGGTGVGARPCPGAELARSQSAVPLSASVWSSSSGPGCRARTHPELGAAVRGPGQPVVVVASREGRRAESGVPGREWPALALEVSRPDRVGWPIPRELAVALPGELAVDLLAERGGIRRCPREGVGVEIRPDRSGLVKVPGASGAAGVEPEAAAGGSWKAARALTPRALTARAVTARAVPLPKSSEAAGWCPAVWSVRSAAHGGCRVPRWRRCRRQHWRQLRPMPPPRPRGLG